MGTSDYREFVKVVEYQNFTVAASALNLSQSTLSRHIAALEAELGVQLIFDEKPFCLTPAGETVYKTSLELIALQDNLDRQLQAYRGLQPERVVIQDLYHLYKLFEKIERAKHVVREQYPNIAFMLADAKPTETPYEMLDNGVDVSFTFSIETLPGDYLKPPAPYRHIHMKDFCGELCFAIPKSSPLAGRNNLRLENLAVEQFMQPARRSHDDFRDGFAKACRMAGFEPRFEMVQVKNFLEFYAHGSDTSIFLLVTRDRSIDSKSPLRIPDTMQISYLEDPLYVNSYMLYRDDRVTKAFKAFLDAVRE